MDGIAALIVAISGLIMGVLITTWLVTVSLGAMFITLDMVGPGWETVFFGVLAVRIATAGNFTVN